MAEDMRKTVADLKKKADTQRRKSMSTKSPEVQKALRDKYPQMYDKDGKLKSQYAGKKESWVQTLKKKVRRTVKARNQKTARTKQVEKAASKSLTQAEIDKMR